MAILWCGGEDIDFPNGNVVSSNAGGRSGYSRSTISPGGPATSPSKSTVFPGGTVTNCWLAYRTNVSASTFIMLGKSGGINALAILTGGDGVVHVGSMVTGTFTDIAATASGVLTGNHRVDFQVVNYGTSGSFTLYMDGVQVLTFSGNISVTGVSGFDSIFLATNAGLYSTSYSEIIVANESTLSFQGLVTMAPTGDGTTQAWSNPSYTGLNPIQINDALGPYVNTPSLDEQVTINSLPSGVFLIKMVKTAVRALATTGAGSTNLKVGFYNGSSVGVGSSHTLSGAFTTYEDYFTTDPTTGVGWSSLTGYQLDLRSA